MKYILTDKEITQILHDWKYKGYACVNVLNDEEISELKNELNRLRIERNEKDPSWGEFGMYSHPHKDSDKILKYLGHSKLLEINELLFGEDCDATQSLAYFKPPGELGRDAHQDGFFSQSGWGKSLNASIALDITNKDNGGMWVYESSHFLPLLEIEIDENRTKTNTEYWRNERGKPCVMPNDHNFPLVFVDMNPGDVVFIHSNTVHGSYENKSNRTRNSLVIGFKTKSAPLKQGTHMKREPIDVYEINKKFYS